MEDMIETQFAAHEVLTSRRRWRTLRDAGKLSTTVQLKATECREHSLLNQGDILSLCCANSRAVLVLEQGCLSALVG